MFRFLDPTCTNHLLFIPVGVRDDATPQVIVISFVLVRSRPAPGELARVIARWGHDLSDFPVRGMPIEKRDVAGSSRMPCSEVVVEMGWITSVCHHECAGVEVTVFVIVKVKISKLTGLIRCRTVRCEHRPAADPQLGKAQGCTRVKHL